MQIRPKHIWRNFLTSGLKTGDFFVSQQLYFINAFSFLAFVVLVIFGVENIIKSINPVVGYTNLAIGSVIALNVLVLRFWKNVTVAKHVLLAAILYVLIFVFIQGGIANTGFLWFFVFPPAVFFLFDRLSARLWTIALFSAIGILAGLLHLRIIASPFSLLEIRQLTAVLAVEAIIVYIFEINRDKRVDELQTKTEKLAASQRQLILAEQVAKMGSWEWDVNTDKFASSYELFNILHVPVSQGVTLKTLRDLIHPEDRDDFMEGIRAVSHADIMSLEDKFRFIPKNEQKVRIFRVIAEPVKNERGQVEKVFAVFMDETELEQSRYEATNKAEEAETLNRLMVGREAKMAELKKEIKRLKEGLKK